MQFRMFLRHLTYGSEVTKKKWAEKSYVLLKIW